MSNSVPQATETTLEDATQPSVPILAPLALDGVNAELLPQEVLASLLPEYAAVPPGELIPISLEISQAVATVFGVLPEVQALRPAIAALSPNYDLAPLDKLEAYTIGLNEAHGRYLTATRPSEELAHVMEEATSLRATLLSDATSLVNRGLLDPKRLTQLKGVVGYRNVSLDLNLLVQALRPNLAVFAGKSAVTEAELDRAARLQQRLLRLVGEKEQSAPATVEATEVRQRAYTCFMRAYDHVRRAVHFLRWKEEDADSITPSLFAGRTRRKGADVPAPVQAADGAQAAAGGAAAGGVAAGQLGNAFQASHGSTAGTVPGTAPGNGAGGAAGNAGTDPFLT